MRFGGQVRAGERHLIEFEKQELQKQRTECQTKCEMKSGVASIKKRKFDWSDEGINRNDASEKHPFSRGTQELGRITTTGNPKHPVRTEFIRNVERRPQTRNNEE